MNKTVKIGKTDVELIANAVTPIHYTAEFQSDFYKDEQAMSEGNVALFLPRITYIMAKQADKSIKEGFEEWLEKFEINDLMLAGQDIAELLAGDLKTTSTAKKNHVQPHEK